MECLEFRRHLGAEPRRETPDMQAHRLTCAGCSEAQARALGFEVQMKRVLNVPVPAGLADRILLAQTTAERRGSGAQRRRWSVGLAAAAAVVVAIGAGGLWRARAAEAFPRLMVEHMTEEPESFASPAPIPVTEVQESFAFRGVHLAAELPKGISYVAPCPIGPYKSVHMVMPEQEGPVTVIYLAGDRQKERGEFQRDVWRGRSVPMGQGTLVLMAQSGRMFDALEQSWRHSIEGDTNSAIGAP